MPQPKTPDVAEPKGPKADFPKFTLEEALGVPGALQRNGGQPLDSIDMATALGRSPGSSAFRQLTAASSAYGLTTGSYKTQFVMAALGQASTQPTSPDEQARSLVAAALRPAVFQAVYDYYKGQRYPEGQFFENTIISLKENPKSRLVHHLRAATGMEELLSSLSALGASQHVGWSCPGFSIPWWAVRRPDESGSWPGQDRCRRGGDWA